MGDYHLIWVFTIDKRTFGNLISYEIEMLEALFWSPPEKRMQSLPPRELAPTPGT
jgi:hypothetical protein